MKGMLNDFIIMLKLNSLTAAFFLAYFLVTRRERIKRWIRKKVKTIKEDPRIFLYVITATVVAYLFLKGKALLPTLVAIVVTLITLVMSLIKKKEQTLLISLTSKYLLEKDEAKIDELLGILIAGTRDKLKVDPVEEFFKALRNICEGSDVEMRRRVSEALPALFRIDLDQAKILVEILRQDWDEAKWKGDNRRRTIEALAYIVREEKGFVNSNLHVMDDDEIYTLIAVGEVLVSWEQEYSKKDSNNRFEQLIQEMKDRHYNEDELRAVVELRTLVNLIRYDSTNAVKKCDEMKDSENVFVQVCVARNFKYLCKGFSGCRIRSPRACNGSPELIMRFMEYFLKEEKHENVRRPIAKEDCLACLIVLLRHQKYKERAKGIMWRLLKDGDTIIRVTAFDRIENILDIDEEFGKEIMGYIIDKNAHQKLVERARRIMKRYVN